jgi:hypothetical protein
MNEYYEIPHLLSPAFTGQAAICKDLDSSLVLSRSAPAQVQRRFVLHSLGGSGKTQICIRYAQVHRNRYVLYTPNRDALAVQGHVLICSQILGCVLD